MIVVINIIERKTVERMMVKRMMDGWMMV